VVFAYVAYNSGYYLPFGGGTPGPRFLTTMLPFLAVPIALTWKRFPAQTLALAVISIVIFCLVTITHPLIGYETETATWTRYATTHWFQPSIVSAFFNGTRGYAAPLPFLVLAAAGLVLAVRATPWPAISLKSFAIAGAIAGAWALVAIVAPTWLGIDHRALENTHNAGDPKALKLPWGDWPLTRLGLVALGMTLALLVVAWWFTGRRPRAETAKVTMREETAWASQ
jgi:glycerol uptake facilitator-like aquaporin